MKTLALTLAALLAGSLAGIAHATAPVKEVRQQIVSYADLNLASATDAEVLLRRIKSAARLVCGLRNAGPMPIDFRSRQTDCAANAVARAVADVDSSSIIVAARD
jgi:UrcA family protein